MITSLNLIMLTIIKYTYLILILILCALMGIGLFIGYFVFFALVVFPLADGNAALAAGMIIFYLTSLLPVSEFIKYLTLKMVVILTFGIK